MTLSCSDYHLEFIGLECLRNAVYAALPHEMEIGFSVITRRSGTVSVDFLKNYLDLPEGAIDEQVFFFETPVMATGRGVSLPEEDFFDAYPVVEAHGRCDTAGRTPTITPDGRLMACCGFPYREIPELDFGSVTDGGLSEALRDLGQDFLVFWIHTVGPHRILQRLGAKMPPEFSSVCEACRHLFVDPHSRALLEEHLENHTPEEIFLNHILGDESTPEPGYEAIADDPFSKQESHC